MRGRTGRDARLASRAPRGPEAGIVGTRTGTAANQPRPPTLGELAEEHPELHRIVCDATVLGLGYSAATASRRPKLAHALRARYGLEIGDLSLRLAIACGGLYHLHDKSQAHWADEVVQWWIRSYSQLRDLLSSIGSHSAEPILAGFVAEYIALSKRLGAYSWDRQPRILNEPLRCAVKATAAYYVVVLLQSRGGRHRDWRTTVQLLECYGHDCGSGRLRQRAEALRQLVRRHFDKLNRVKRRTRPAS
jgi:hypothetical protein